MSHPSNSEILTAIAALGDRMDKRFSALEAKVGSLEAKVGSLDAKVGSLDAKVGSLEAKVGILDAKVEGNTLAIVEMRGEMKGLSAWLSSMDQRFVAIMRPYEPPADRGRA